MNLRQLVLSAALIASPVALYAQTAPVAPPPPAPVAPTVPVTGRTIAERKTDQQQRIAQGVRSGELTRGETRHLENKEHGINREERAMRATHDGHLSKADKRILTRQQNATSRQIYNKKHNDKVQK